MKQLNVPLDNVLMSALKAEARRRGMMLYALVKEIMTKALRVDK